jgi:hypothetical protein
MMLKFDHVGGAVVVTHVLEGHEDVQIGEITRTKSGAFGFTPWTNHVRFVTLHWEDLHELSFRVFGLDIGGDNGP